MIHLVLHQSTCVVLASTALLRTNSRSWPSRHWLLSHAYVRRLRVSSTTFYSLVCFLRLCQLTKVRRVLNALIKLFFVRRTNKGRKNSGDRMTHLKSYLVPLGRLVQRCMLWVANHVPKELWGNDYEFLSSPNPFGDETGNKDIIFDSDAVQQESV